MPECTNCGAYTKYNGGLCFKCYKEQGNGEVIEENLVFEDLVSEESQSGLTDRDRNYRYNMIKGRIAETLILELFQE